MQPPQVTVRTRIQRLKNPDATACCTSGAPERPLTLRTLFGRGVRFRFSPTVRVHAGESCCLWIGWESDGRWSEAALASLENTWQVRSNLTRTTDKLAFRCRGAAAES